MNRKYKYNLNQTVSDFQFLYTSSLEFYKTYQEIMVHDACQTDKSKMRSGWSIYLSASIVFCAFWVEAYTNYIFQTIYPNDWAEYNKKPTEEKIRYLFEKTNKCPNFKNTVDVIKMIFDHRNSMAHNKAQFSEPKECYISEDKYMRMSNDIMCKPYKSIDNPWSLERAKISKYDFIELCAERLEFLYDFSKDKKIGLFHPRGHSSSSLWGISIE